MPAKKANHNRLSPLIGQPRAQEAYGLPYFKEKRLCKTRISWRLNSTNLPQTPIERLPNITNKAMTKEDVGTRSEHWSIPTMRTALQRKRTRSRDRL
jgi:hypothetical protein